ncbi:hypothetical protein C0J52_14477 [Blattella germanica]|nr:hypothetical protein C0J52_14477 [Blattella germanica]
MLGKLLCAYLIVSCCPKPLAVTMARQQTQQQHQQKQVKQLVKCGGDISSSDKGTIQTPYFPGPFPVPIRCQWVIDASDRFPPNNYSIVIYLTQLYVTTGLTFTEFAYYEKGATSIGRQLVHSVTEQNVTRVHWLWTRSPFLVIDFELDRLEGNHLRVMDNLLDVYGVSGAHVSKVSRVLIVAEVLGVKREDTCVKMALLAGIWVPTQFYVIVLLGLLEEGVKSL